MTLYADNNQVIKLFISKRSYFCLFFRKDVLGLVPCANWNVYGVKRLRWKSIRFYCFMACEWTASQWICGLWNRKWRLSEMRNHFSLKSQAHAWKWHLCMHNNNKAESTNSLAKIHWSSSSNAFAFGLMSLYGNHAWVNSICAGFMRQIIKRCTK